MAVALRVLVRMRLRPVGVARVQSEAVALASTIVTEQMPMGVNRVCQSMRTAAVAVVFARLPMPREIAAVAVARLLRAMLGLRIAMEIQVTDVK